MDNFNLDIWGTYNLVLDIDSFVFKKKINNFRLDKRI